MQSPSGGAHNSRYNMNYNMTLLESDASDLYTTLGSNNSSRQTVPSHLNRGACGSKRTAEDAELSLHHEMSTGRPTIHTPGMSEQCAESDDSYSQGQQKKTPPPNGKKTKGRVKIKMEFIDNKLRRYTTFSKRKTGIMKKAYELSTLTGTQVMLLVASETGHVYTFATRKLQPMITSEAGKALIQTCLNSPDPPAAGSTSHDQRMSATGFEETELSYNITDDEQKDPLSPKSPQAYSGSSSRNGSVSPASPELEAPSTLLPLSSPSPPATSHGVASTSSTSVKQEVPLHIPPPGFATILTPTSMMMSGNNPAVSYPGTVMYQTSQGVVYATPNSAVPNGVIFSLAQTPVQIAQAQGHEAGNVAGASQQYITIPLPVSLAAASSQVPNIETNAADLSKPRK